MSLDENVAVPISEFSLRSLMPVCDRWAYFDHAACAPLPQPTADAMRSWIDDVSTDGVVNWSRWRREVEQTRRLAATLINASTDEIALIHNTTDGISLVAEGCDWQPGDNVVVPDSEFPSNLYPWMHLADRGVECRQVACPDGQIDLDRISEACNERTRIVAASWVGYTTGDRVDLSALAEVAHQHGALLLIDAIQGLGALPLDVTQTPVDFVVAGGHKWMFGPEGVGLLYVRRQHLDRLRPIGVGWNSVTHAGDFTNHSLQLKPTADRYEGGTFNMVGLIGFGASLKLLTDIGSESVARQLREVTDRLCDRLTSIGGEVASRRDETHWSGIVSVALRCGEPPSAVQRRCRDAGVVINHRAGRLRISPHIDTSTEDIDRLINVLDHPS